MSTVCPKPVTPYDKYVLEPNEVYKDQFSLFKSLINIHVANDTHKHMSEEDRRKHFANLIAYRPTDMKNQNPTGNPIPFLPIINASNGNKRVGVRGLNENRVDYGVYVENAIFYCTSIPRTFPPCSAETNNCWSSSSRIHSERIRDAEIETEFLLYGPTFFS